MIITPKHVLVALAVAAAILAAASAIFPALHLLTIAVVMVALGLLLI